MAARTTPGKSRISFAKISEPLALPQLLSLQTDSFDWLIGNEAHKARIEARIASGVDATFKSGLEEIFEEISPIEDFSETMSLSFDEPRVLRPEVHHRRVQGAGRSPTPRRCTSRPSS